MPTVLQDAIHKIAQGTSFDNGNVVILDHFTTIERHNSTLEITIKEELIVRTTGGELFIVPTSSINKARKILNEYSYDLNTVMIALTLAVATYRNTV